MSEKEQYLNVITQGENLGKLAKTDYSIQHKMDNIIKYLSVVDASDTRTELINCCLLAETDCMSLIEIGDLDEELQRKTFNYFILGYNSGKAKERK